MIVKGSFSRCQKANLLALCAILMGLSLMHCPTLCELPLQYDGAVIDFLVSTTQMIDAETSIESKFEYRICGSCVNGSEVQHQQCNCNCSPLNKGFRLNFIHLGFLHVYIYCVMRQNVEVESNGPGIK